MSSSRTAAAWRGLPGASSGQLCNRLNPSTNIRTKAIHPQLSQFRAKAQWGHIRRNRKSSPPAAETGAGHNTPPSTNKMMEEHDPRLSFRLLNLKKILLIRKILAEFSP